MASPVTEIATLSTNDLLKADPGLFVELTQFVKNKRAPGAQRQAWGSRVEEPEKWVWLLDWESLEHYEQARASPPSNSGFKEKLSELVTSPPSRIHVQFSPFEGYNRSLAAPVTEFLFITLKDTTDVKTFDNLTEAVLVAAGNCKGCLSWSWGHNVENEQSAVAIIGWESIEAHEKFRDTDGFRRTTPLLFETVSEVKMFHVKFEQQNI